MLKYLKKNDFAKMCFPRVIWFCLFTCLCITLKELKSLPETEMFSCHSGRKVTHQTAVPKVPGSNTGSYEDFVFAFLL